jgi:hypothetical protein
MQVGLLLAFQREIVPQMLGAYHILQHSHIIWPKAEYNKRLPEDRVLRVKGKDLQRQVWPVSLMREPLKLLMHHQIVADPALQD